MIGYIPNETNAPLSLYEGYFELHARGLTFSTKSPIIVRWFPRPYLTLAVSAFGTEAFNRALSFFSRLVDPEDLEIVDPRGQVRCKCDGFRGASASLEPEEFHFEVGLAYFEKPIDSTIDHAIFHVVNLAGPGLRQEILLSGEGWKIGFRPARSETLYDRMNGQQAFATTHIGIVERSDHSSFKPDDLEDLFEGLYYFLSFLSGAWCWPCIYMGTSLSQHPWLRCTQAKDITPLESPLAAPILFTANLIPATASFEGFLRLWSDTEWRAPLKTAISWAIDGRRSRSIESSLVGGQAALELISWIQIVETEKILSSEGFDKLPAADRLRLLLNLQKISTNLSSSTPDLTAYSNSRRPPWDGPRVLAELRNSIVHPKRRETLYRTSEKVRQQARDLTESYLSFALLRLFGFSGPFPKFGRF